MREEANKAIKIPGYSIENEIGKGGMATVYIAVQESLRRRVALKVMAPALTSDKNFADRFLKEGQIVAQLDHPQIVTVFDFGTHHNLYYLSMEYLPGGTLEQRIRDGLTSERAVQIIKTIAEALGYAHSQGVLHRDIKPHNILFRRNDRPVLTDFGIARFIDDNVHLTAPGLTVGSPSYMSPERVSGKKIDARSDLYSLGVVFYQMLTGELPYQADSPISVAIKHCSEPLPVLPSACGKFQPILNQLLAKEPEDRFPNAEAFVTALDDFETQQYSLKLSQPLPTTTPSKAPSISYKKGLMAGGLIVALSASAYFAINTPFSSNQGSSIIDLQALPPAAEARSPIAGRYEELAIETLEEGNLKQSLALIDIGLGSVPKDPRLTALRKEIANLQKANARFEEAQQLQQQGELPKSLAKIQEGLKLVPNYSKLLELRKTVVSLQTANARFEEAQQLQQQGELQKSLAKIQEGLNAAPDHSALLELGEKVQTQVDNHKQADEHFQQAQQHFQKRAYEESLKSIQEGLQLVPDHAELLALRDEVKAGIDLEQEVDRVVKQAQELEQTGALVEALVILDGGQQRAPDHPKILALRDKIGSALARQKEANELLQQAQKQYQQGQLQESLERIAQGLKLVPKQADLLALQEEVQTQWQQQQAELAETQRRQQAAQRLLQHAQEQYKDDALAESLKSVEEGLKEVPNHPELQALRTKVQTTLARQQEADELLQQAQKQYQQGQLQESLERIAQGLKLVPKQADLLALQEEVQAQWEQQQAELAETQRRQQAAKRLLQQAQEQYKDDALAESLKSVEEGLKEVPNHPELQALRTKVQTTLARQQEADELLQQAQQQHQEGQLQESLESIAQGLKLVPKQADLLALQEKVQTQWEQQQAELAETERRQQAAKRLLQQAKALYQEGELEQSLNLIDEGLEQVADHPDLRALRDTVQSTFARQQEADELLQQAQQLWQDGDLDKSLALVEEGLLLVPEQPDLLLLQGQIKQRLTEQKEIAEALKNCPDDARFDALNSEQTAQAVACYQGVLQRQPENSEARQAIQQLADQYAKLTEQAIASGAENQAKDLLDRLEQLDAAYPELSSLKERLTVFTEQSQQVDAKDQLAALLQECAAHVEANRLTTGQGGTALDCYNQVLAEDPNNNEAQKGLEQIAAKYASWATSALGRKDNRRAERHLQRLEKVNPQHPQLATLRNELQALQNARQRQAEEANRLLQQARQRYQNGDLGESMALIEQGLRQSSQHPGLVNLKREVQTKLDQQRLRQATAQQQREKADLLLSQAQRRYANGAFEESLSLVNQGLELVPNHNRLQTLRQEIQAKLAEATEPASPEDEDTGGHRKRIFGTF